MGTYLLYVFQCFYPESRESSLAICIRIYTEIYVFLCFGHSRSKSLRQSVEDDSPSSQIYLHQFIFFWNTNFRKERTLVYRRRQPPNVLLRSWRNWATWVPWWHGRTSWDKSSRSWWWWWWWWSYCFLFVWLLLVVLDGDANTEWL